MRTPLVAGNWKMFKTVSETKEYLKKFLELVKDVEDREVMIAPPFTSLQAASEELKGTRVKLGAQNVHWEAEGAFTGEVSPKMLRELGVEYVIVGHSERRHIFGETNELIKKRLKGAISFGLKPVLCVGETLEEREAGRTEEVLKVQLEILKHFSLDELRDLVIAYEPVWAIGTGKTATPAQAQEAQAFIRSFLRDLFDEEFARRVRILYGGSVKPENASELMSQPDVDGVLVGGASLDPEKFSKIVKFEACLLPDYSQIPKDLLEVVKTYKKIAIVGASPKPERPSHMVMKYLLEKGFDVVPVNPGQKEILGRKCYRSLSEIPEGDRPEVVLVFRRSDQVLPVAEEAVKVGAKVFWMQEGVINEEAKALVERHGLKAVMNLCFKKVHQISQTT